MEKAVFLFCAFLSCFIIVSILYQFMNERYQKTYQSKAIYYITEAVIVVVMAAVNLMNIWGLNLFLWVLSVAAGAFFLYFDRENRPLKRIIECEVLLFCMCVCETLGVVLLDWGVQLADLQITSPVMLNCLEVTFSKVTVIFFYYMIVGRLMKKSHIPFTKKQYVLQVIVLLYSLVNLLVIANGVRNDSAYGLLTINMGCIVLADLYLLYFIRVMGQKNYYETEVKALEQQAKLQYEYYLQQEQKYNQTTQILHDVNKHIKTIKELCISGNAEESEKYAEQIGGILKPLIPIRYTGNPILDILLTDKAEQIRTKGIDFIVNMNGVCFEFMDAIDITTIFGNLLDNAIEACEAVQGKADRKIVLTAESFHEMVSVAIENDSNPVKWRRGVPISEKGKDRGIGLLNVHKSIDKYDGDLKLREDQGKFIAEFFINS